MVANPDSTNSPPKRGTSRSPKVALAVGLGLLALLIVGVFAAHAMAHNAYQRSFDRTATLQQRADAAALARRIEPWNERYSTRSVVMTKWLHGSILLSQGADLPAMLELQAAYRMAVGDQELLALFKKSQEQLNINSNYKAHVQHGREGPGGTLRPDDILR